MKHATTTGEAKRAEFPNPWSRVILEQATRRQFVLPDPPPKAVTRFLTWYEAHVLDIDLHAVHIDRPIFLVGLPRSGTTMLQDILCAHPKVAYVSNVVNRFHRGFCAADHIMKALRLDFRVERYHADSVVVSAHSPNDGVGFWAPWLKQDPFDTTYIERKLEHYSPGEIEELRIAIRKVLWCFGYLPHRFFSKNPALLPHLVLLAELFPNARFIHLVRDPRQTANSLVKLYRIEQRQLELLGAIRPHGVLGTREFIPYPRLPRLSEYVERFGAGSIQTTARLWRDAVRWVLELKPRLPAVYEVRYEDILANPRDEVSRILDFCELSEVPPSHRSFWERIEQVGVIHHENRYGDFEAIRDICKEGMERYGYA